MVNYILVVFNHKPESGCSGGRFLGRISIWEGYDAAFNACYKNRRCGCIDTCHGGFICGGDWTCTYLMYEGSTTKDNPGSDACHSWVKKNGYCKENGIIIRC